LEMVAGQVLNLELEMALPTASEIKWIDCALLF
jgi:hypothetical protein